MSEISKISVNGVGYDVCDETARSRCDSLGDDVAKNMTEITAINSDLGVCQGNIQFNKDDIDDIYAKVGTEELTTTSQTLIGAINEVKDSVGESGGSVSGVCNAYGWYVNGGNIDVAPNSYGRISVVCTSATPTVVKETLGITNVSHTCCIPSNRYFSTIPEGVNVVNQSAYVDNQEGLILQMLVRNDTENTHTIYVNQYVTVFSVNFVS